MHSMPITQSMAPSWCVRCVIILFIPHQESAPACEVLRLCAQRAADSSSTLNDAYTPRSVQNVK